MSKLKSKIKKKIPPAIWLALLGFVITIWVAILGFIGNIMGPIVVEHFNRTPIPPTLTFSCIQADDILVKFHLARNDKEIAILSPRETVPLEPGLIVYFQVEIISIFPDRPLPPTECTWTNTGIATDGRLLHNTGCTVDYQSGLKVITDTVTMQLSQPSCPSLSPIPFFIISKP